MAVHAPMATALQGLPVTATPCGAGTRPLQLPAGANRFAMQANNLVRPQTLQFNRADVAPTPSASPAPQPRLLHWGATNRSVQVSASTASLLVVHENQNAGWHATIDGKRLTATTVDGWQQAWLLPAGTSGVVHLVYAPQRTVIVGLAVGAAAALILIGLALWRRRRPDVRPALRDGSIRPLLGAGIVVAVLFLLGSGYGVVAALVALVVVRLSRRRPVAVWLAGAALAVVAGCEFVAPVTSSHPLASSVGVQALCLLAVAIVLAYGLASRRPPPGLGESP
jgi:arabinofuranan 3-O-arabinosyltransferase